MMTLDSDSFLVRNPYPAFKTGLLQPYALLASNEGGCAGLNGGAWRRRGGGGSVAWEGFLNMWYG
jgi:hypothetical protein